MNKKILITMIVVAIAGGWGLSVLLSGDADMTLMQADKKETAVEHAAKHADPNYVCPMHPQILRGEPGSCPICGMDLVKVEVEEPAAKSYGPLSNYICELADLIVCYLKA